MKTISSDPICIAGNTADLPILDLPEIALCGRSNAGKSTLLNRLTNRKNLARTSNAPGRTQALHLYGVTVRDSDDIDHSIVLADLPGYGYAKLSKTQRGKILRMLEEYLSKRASLTALCILIDCRRVPQEEELALQAAAFHSGRHLIPVATKIDKLNQRELHSSLKAISQAFHLERADIVTAGEKVSVDPVWARILAVVP